MRSDWLLFLGICLVVLPNCRAAEGPQARAAAVPPADRRFISGMVLDGLGRPVADAQIKVERSGALGDRMIGRLMTDAQGRYQGSIRTDPQKDWLSVSKTGYNDQRWGPGWNAVSLTSVVQRVIGASDLDRLAELTGASLDRAVEEILAGDVPAHDVLHERLFYQEEHLRPALRSALGNERLIRRAALLLCMIAEPDDVACVLVRRATLPEVFLLRNPLDAVVAGALIHPGSEAEWAFLNELVRSGQSGCTAAIRSLAANGSERAMAILETNHRQIESGPDARKAHRDLMRLGIERITSKALLPCDSDLRVAIQRSLPLCTLGEEMESKLSAPQMNKARTKALVRCEFAGDGYYKSYTICFHRRGSEWVLMSITLGAIT